MYKLQNSSKLKLEKVREEDKIIYQFTDFDFYFEVKNDTVLLFDLDILETEVYLDKLIYIIQVHSYAKYPGDYNHQKITLKLIIDQKNQLIKIKKSK